tara:strand:+ start:179 stop:772 length:594 start_codon:yes stop_codon:yes gene_type:complete
VGFLLESYINSSMAKTIFDPLKDLQGGQQRATTWYRNAVSLIADRTSQNQLMREGRINGQPSAGRMNFFVYDPKYKKTLPFYDTFPLVLPLEPIKGGFMGLNFHYLPYPLRFRLLERMQKFANNNQFDSSTKLMASYQDVAKINLIRPAIKKYLYKQCLTGFRRIDVDEMAIAVYLPVANFKKRSIGSVFADSRRKI